MERPESTTRRTPLGLSARLLVLALLSGLFIAGAPGNAEAQFFDSGSDGSQGPFPPVPAGGMPATYGAIVWNVRTGHVWYCSGYTFGTGLDACDGTPIAEAQIPIPVSGLTNGAYHFTNFAFTAVNGQTRVLYVVGASPNAPLSILSQTDIVISGTPSGNSAWFFVKGGDGRTPADSARNLAVFGGRGGPGGFDGGQSGNGATTPGNGSAGFGPAGGVGGNASSSSSGGLLGGAAQATGLNPALTPLTGGSGGGGGAGVAPSPLPQCNGSANGYAGGGGGGGGGALLLAASNRVTIADNGIIWANGGNGGGSFSSCSMGAGGAGGSVRIVATELTGASGAIHVEGGVVPAFGIPSSGGFVRFETSFNTYTGGIIGSAGGSFISFPTAPIPSNQPLLRISSINGTSAPQTPSASLVTPDIAFAAPISQPVTLNVEASNVPLGTTVNIRVAPAVGAPSVTATSGLAGSVASSSASATVTLPPGAGVVTATATFNVGGTSLAMNLPTIDGERPQQMQIETLADGSTKTYLIARSGARFEMGRARQ